MKMDLRASDCMVACAADAVLEEHIPSPEKEEGHTTRARSFALM